MDDLFPQPIFTVLGIPIRDTVLSTWVMMLLITLVVWIANKRRPMLLRMLTDLLEGAVSGVMDRPVRPYLPLLGTLTIFIAMANSFGVVPVFISPTRDLSTPVALALVVFFSVHYYGVREKGWKGYLADLANPIFLLPLEIISQISRTLSLTLRLFGNVISTELIVAVVFSLIPVIAPLPLIGFSLFAGVLQAYIFTVLAGVYIESAVAADEA